MTCPRRVLVPISLASMVALLVGCSDSTISDADAGGGGQELQVEVNEDNCGTEEGEALCEALRMEQVAVEATASGSFVELTTRDGDPFNTFVGEGELVESGDRLDVVCLTEDDYGRITLGVILRPEFDLGHVDAASWAPGTVDGTNLEPVAFLPGDGIDDVETVREELGSQLADRYDELDPRNSCEDHRVVWDGLDRRFILAPA